MVDSLVRSPKAATTEHALESERSRGETEAVCGTVAVGELDDDGTVCPARDLAPGGIQHPGALPAGGLGGSGGRQSCTAPSSQPDAARDRAADCRIAAPAHALGTAQAEGGAGGPAAGPDLAGRQHDGRTVAREGLIIAQEAAPHRPL